MPEYQIVTFTQRLLSKLPLNLLQLGLFQRKNLIQMKCYFISASTGFSWWKVNYKYLNPKCCQIWSPVVWWNGNSTKKVSHQMKLACYLDILLEYIHFLLNPEKHEKHLSIKVGRAMSSAKPQNMNGNNGYQGCLPIILKTTVQNHLIHSGKFIYHQCQFLTLNILR